MGVGNVEAAHIIESQPDNSCIHCISLNVDEEIFEPLVPHEMQNQSCRIGYGLNREEWQKDDGRRISYNSCSNREDEAAAALFSAWRWGCQAISRC